MLLLIEAIISACALLLGTGLTYKATTRVASGSISTTAADTLWEEVNRVKDDYQKQAVDARGESSRIREELDSLQEVCASLRSRVIEVERSAREAKMATQECQEREAVLLHRLRTLEAS